MYKLVLDVEDGYGMERGAGTGICETVVETYEEDRGGLEASASDRSIIFTKTQDSCIPVTSRFESSPAFFQRFSRGTLNQELSTPMHQIHLEYPNSLTQLLSHNAITLPPHHSKFLPTSITKTINITQALFLSRTAA